MSYNKGFNQKCEKKEKNEKINNLTEALDVCK